LGQRHRNFQKKTGSATHRSSCLCRILAYAEFCIAEQRRNGSRIAPLTPEDADQITTAAQRTTSTEPWSPARSSIVRRSAAQGIRKTVLWKARASFSGKENRSENGRSGRNHFAAAAACQINQKQLRWITLTQLALSLAPRARDAIASALECGRGSSAALRNNLRSPSEHQRLDARAP
jgi:hypothetical protein